MNFPYFDYPAPDTRALSIDNGLVAGPYLKTPRLYQEGLSSDVKDRLQGLLKDVSLTELRRQYPLLDVYFQASSYHKLFTEIFNTYYDVVASLDSESVNAFERDEFHNIQYLGRLLDFTGMLIAQLDILGVIDHTPLGDELFQLAFDGDGPIKVWRRFARANSQASFREYFGHFKQAAFVDDASNMLRRMSLQTRRSYMVQRVLNAITQANKAGWYVVFDSLTLADDRVDAFYRDKNAIRDHMRGIGRKVLLAEGRPVRGSFDDCFEYFCVPEYGTKHGRLHFHVVYLMRTLPLGSFDPNAGMRTRLRRELNSLQGLWAYGFNKPIAVRYHGDAFGYKSNWLWPQEKDGRPLASKPAVAVAFYVTKYVNKNTDQNFTRLNLGENKWNHHLRQILLSLPSHTFRVRMSRGFGLSVPPMENLSVSTLSEMTKLSTKVTPLSSLLKRNARKKLRSILGEISVADVLAARPLPTPLLKSLRNLMRNTLAFNPQNFIDILTPKLRITDISEECHEYLRQNKLFRSDYVGPNFTSGRK